MAETTNLVPVADTSIHDVFPSNNFGGGTTFTAGGRLMGGISRALIRFDIAGAIPTGATINSVALTVTVIATSSSPDVVNSTFALNRLTADWGEGAGSDLGVGSPGNAGEATWETRFGPGTPWTSPGGDYSVSASATQPIAGNGTYVFASPALATDIQNWLDNPAGNFGWLLRSEAEATPITIRRFSGRADPSTPPVLAIQYTVPTAPAPPVLFDTALVGASLRFSFNAASNHAHVVEFRNALGTGIWNTLTNIPAFPADTTVHITNAATGDERYFRVGAQ